MSDPPAGTLFVLVGRHHAYVDEADYERVAALKWRPLRRRSGAWHAIAHKPGQHGKTVVMHRMLLGVEDPEVLVYHADGNGLHNWRANLRVYRKLPRSADD
jgi:lipoate-protein ligase A